MDTGVRVNRHPRPRGRRVVYVLAKGLMKDASIKEILVSILKSTAVNRQGKLTYIVF